MLRLALICSIALGVSGCYLRHGLGDDPGSSVDASVDGRAPAGAPGRDGSVPGASDDGGRAGDGGPPRTADGCLTFEVTGSGSGALRLAGFGDALHVVADTLSTPEGGLVLVEARRIGSRGGCVALLGPDLRPRWATSVDVERTEHPQLALVGGRPHVVGFPEGQVVRAAIDLAEGTVGAPTASPGFGGVYEWVRAVGAPDGRLFVAWNDSWLVHVGTLGPAGDLLAAPAPLAPMARYPHVARDGDAWIVGAHELRGGAVSGPMALRVADDGSASEPAYPDTPTLGGAHLHVDRTERGLVAAWSRAGGLRFAHLDDALAPTAEPTTVLSLRRRDGAASDGASLRDVHIGSSASVLAYQDHRTRMGGVLLVPWDAPARARVLFERSYDFSAPAVVLAGRVAVVLTADRELIEAVRLPLD